MTQNKGTRLQGKVAIVTGAGSCSSVPGTGQATSILFAREGAKVLLVDRNRDNALKTLNTIKQEGLRTAENTPIVSITCIRF